MPYCRTWIIPFVIISFGCNDHSGEGTTPANTVFPVGLLLQSIVDFIIIALVLFGIIKAMNTINRKKETQAAEVASPKYTLTEQLLMDIRDNFKDGNSKKTDINV